jgi:uncharacterized RDD family membrane protein YckC
MNYEEYVAYEPVLSRRVVAAVLDYILYFTLVLGYIYFFGKRNDQGLMEVNGFRHVFMLFLIWVVYFPVVEGTFGYTAFKGILDLKVVQERRSDFGFAVSFKRHMVDFIDFFLFGVVAIIMVKVSSEHKRLGDRIAHSHVVMDKEQP